MGTTDWRGGSMTLEDIRSDLASSELTPTQRKAAFEHLRRWLRERPDDGEAKELWDRYEREFGRQDADTPITRDTSGEGSRRSARPSGEPDSAVYRRRARPFQAGRSRCSWRPGKLRTLLDVITDGRGNSVSVDHHRAETTTTALQIEVELVVATRDRT